MGFPCILLSFSPHQIIFQIRFIDLKEIQVYILDNVPVFSTMNRLLKKKKKDEDRVELHVNLTYELHRTDSGQE
jgi:hypothetical protein